MSGSYDYDLRHARKSIPWWIRMFVLPFRPTYRSTDEGYWITVKYFRGIMYCTGYGEFPQHQDARPTEPT